MCIKCLSRKNPAGRGVMRRLRNYLQHRFNPVHLYCRLRDLGLGKSKARKMCSAYERFVYVWMNSHMGAS